jgi:carbonic anhydrase
LGIAVVAFGCTPAADEGATPARVGVHWGYEGEESPAHWAELSPAFALCAEGTRQSPIDLTAPDTVEATAVARDYEPASLSVVRKEHVVDLLDNGHTIQVSYDEGSTLTLEDTDYELVQYHFHMPSEHTVDGRHSALELHLVHQSAAGELAVIGVLVDEGEYNPIAAPLVESLPAQPGDTVHLEHVTFEIDELLPDDPRYYRYEGSLTTPPCTEGVQWLVMVGHGHAASEQLARFAAVMPDNNRPVQPRRARPLVIDVGQE